MARRNPGSGQATQGRRGAAEQLPAQNEADAFWSGDCWLSLESRGIENSVIEDRQNLFRVARLFALDDSHNLAGRCLTM